MSYEGSEQGYEVASDEGSDEGSEQGFGEDSNWLPIRIPTRTPKKSFLWVLSRVSTRIPSPMRIAFEVPRRSRMRCTIKVRMRVSARIR